MFPTHSFVCSNVFHMNILLYMPLVYDFMRVVYMVKAAPRRPGGWKIDFVLADDLGFCFVSVHVFKDWSWVGKGGRGVFILVVTWIGPSGIPFSPSRLVWVLLVRCQVVSTRLLFKYRRWNRVFYLYLLFVLYLSIYINIQTYKSTLSPLHVVIKIIVPTIIWRVVGM